MKYTLEFNVDLGTTEGREQAAYLEAWLAVQRYDCPDTSAGGSMNSIMADLRGRLYGERD